MNLKKGLNKLDFLGLGLGLEVSIRSFGLGVNLHLSSRIYNIDKFERVQQFPQVSSKVELMQEFCY